MSNREDGLTEESVTGDAGKSVVLLIYVGVLALLILAPFDFDTPRDVWSGVSQDLDRYETEPTDLAVDLAKSLAHAVLFLPLAPLLAWTFRFGSGQLFSVRILLGVVSFSAALELLQLWVSRGTSVSDFLMNIVGYVGGVVAFGCYRRSPRLQATAALILSTESLLVVLGVLLVSLHLALRPDNGTLLGLGGLHSWNLDYPLLVGNEQNGSRAWLGTFERVAIRGDVESGGEGERQSVIYDFQPETLVVDGEGRVREIQAPGGPTLLVDGSGVVVARDDGIELHRETTLRAHGEPWRRLLESIRDSDEFSLEARFRPSSLEQFGPARILSSSSSIAQRNFTLAQSGDALELRFRTPLSGPNGTRPSLRVRGCLAVDRVTEVLVTYSRGVLKLRVDGEEKRSLKANGMAWVCIRFFGSPPTRRLALGLGLVWGALCFVPVWVLLKRRRVRFPWSSLTAGAVAVVLLVGVALLSA